MNRASNKLVVRPTATQLASGETRKVSLSANDAAFFASPRLGFKSELLTEPYRQHGPTYMIMRALASNVSQVPFQVRTGRRKDPRVADDVGPGSEWLRLFEEPNPDMNAAVYWEAIVLWLSLSGECRVFKEARDERPIGPDELPHALWPLDGRQFEPLLDKRERQIVGWARFVPGQAKPDLFRPHELLPIKYYNPYDPLRGLAPWEPSAMPARQDFKASLYNEAFFDNDASPGIVLLSQRRLTRDQRLELEEQWLDEHQGYRKRRRIAVLNNGLDVKELSSTHREMEFAALKNLTLNEQLGIFKVPKSEVSLHENLNFATSQSADRGFWTKTLIPILKLIEWAHWQHLMKPASAAKFWLEFDLTTIEALRANFDQKLKSAERLQKMGYPLNEVNELVSLGAKAQPHGEVILVGGGLKSLEQVLLGAAKPSIEDEPNKIADDEDDSDETPPETPPEPENEDEPSPTEGPREKTQPVPSGGLTDAQRQQIEAFVARRNPADEKTWLLVVSESALPFYAAFESKLRRYLFELRCRQLALLASKAVFDVIEWNQRLRGRVIELYRQIARSAALGVGKNVLEENELLALVEDRLTLLNGVNDSLYRKLRNANADEQFVKRLFAAAKGRAEILARTEVMAAVNATRYAAFERAAVKRHRWVCARNEALRTAHFERERVERDLGEEFAEGLRYPGDTSGSYEEIALCSCLTVPTDN